MLASFQFGWRIALLFTLSSVFTMSGAAEASVYRYAYESGPLFCTGTACGESPEAIEGFRFEMVVNEALLPQGTLRDTFFRFDWGAGWWFDLGPEWSREAPAWMVSVESNYRTFADDVFNFSGGFATDSERQIHSWEITNWAFDCYPYDYGISSDHGAGLSFNRSGQDRCESSTYRAYIAETPGRWLVAPVPLPAAFVPFAATLTLVAGGVALRRSPKAHPREE